MNALKPSCFTAFPWDSRMQNSESEQVAVNIMVIRKRLGDKWDLTWEEYARERQIDGKFSSMEQGFFDEVYPMIKDAVGAIGFSPSWTEAARKAQVAA